MDEYTAKIHDFLHRIPVGKSYTVDRICKAETKERFIEAVALYQHGYPFCGGIYFTNEKYERFYRFEIPQAAWDALNNQ